MRKRKAGHDLVQSTIRLEPIAIWDSETLLPVSGTELNSACVDFLMDITDIQNQLIQANHQSLPHRTNDQFGTQWARDHIEGTIASLIPENYIERYWTLTGCKIGSPHHPRMATPPRSRRMARANPVGGNLC